MFLPNSPFSLILLTAVLCFNSCTKSENQTNGKKVSIERVNGKYTLYKNGKPFTIKGAGGSEHLDVLAEAGGNAIRIWDTIGLKEVMEQAKLRNLSVIVGLPMPESRFSEYYDSPKETSKQFNAFKKIVNTYKDHPSLLMWCVGNELGFSFNVSNLGFYKQFNNIVDMVHQDDPNHPVTTTLKNLQRKELLNLKIRTDVDIVSFNIFGRLSNLRNDLDGLSWFWRGPYLVSEWGIDGPWKGTRHTIWSAYLETTSNNKAEQLMERYRKYMPVDDPRFLGSFLFYWGQKQETTHTWFSIFEEDGSATEAVSVAKMIWSRKSYSYEFTKIKYMVLNNAARENHIFEPQKTFDAEVLLLKQNPDISKIRWEIYPEDWYKRNNLYNTKKLKPIESRIIHDASLQAKFKTPDKEGPYRIFATIYDKFGNVATCNIPFYVMEDK